MLERAAACRGLPTRQVVRQLTTRCTGTLDPKTGGSAARHCSWASHPRGYQVPDDQCRRLYEQIAETVRDYLIAATGGGPALVVFEDVHWYDEAPSRSW